MKRLMKDQKGQLLIGTLLLLLIGTLIIVPTLGLMGTGITSGRVYEQKDDEIYAADSGVEDALWHIRNDNIAAPLGAGYNEYDYFTNYPYAYNLTVNGKNVAVNITNEWIPKDISAPSAQTAKQIIDNETLIIVGYPSSTAFTYVIKIVYNWDTTAHRDALQVKTIGIWLSPGYGYVTGSSDFEKASGKSYYSVPTVSNYKGGFAVVWNFNNVALSSFPNKVTDSPLVETFTFQYTGPAGQVPELVASWVQTKDNVPGTNYNYSWDDSIRLYKIVSQAGDVTVEAHGGKTKFRKLKSTISSDYAVAGNTLMTTLSGNPSQYRDKLFAESSSTMTRIPLQSIPASGIVPAGYIPEEATIDKVYLYWSGWIDYHYWYKSGFFGYTWGEIPALKYSSNTKAQLIANSMVNMVKFAVSGGAGSSAQTETANVSGVHNGGVPDIQITQASDCIGATDSWEYSCFKDVTNLVVSGNVTVQQYIENAMKTAGSGTVTFTVGHANEVRGLFRSGYPSYNFSLYNTGQNTSYPLGTPAFKYPGGSYDTEYQWAYADWSLIIFYSSPALIQRQLYLYDNIITVPYHSGGEEIDHPFPVGGFLAPPVMSANDTSHITYFVGEGDYESIYSGSKVKVNSNWLSDPPGNPVEDVLNSYSSGLPVTNTDGEDVDTFVLPTGCILPYDTSATITLASTIETYTFVYLVLSFRSELTTGGIITNYAIKII